MTLIYLRSVSIKPILIKGNSVQNNIIAQFLRRRNLVKLYSLHQEQNMNKQIENTKDCSIQQSHNHFLLELKQNIDLTTSSFLEIYVCTQKSELFVISCCLSLVMHLFMLFISWFQFFYPFDSFLVIFQDFFQVAKHTT